eukprot:TRINITY_DN1777_c0_g1_i6.p1 TRINITY_DN1777_c0_g1~~TRINITY_DN1777_c0_g1_i6.p1  ORF type:complete len:334 (+),score=33.25 TRINITY_DN1777_c0_g1_i6:210-1211(+)
MSVSAATGFDFEGAEKKLKVDFVFTAEKVNPLGLRTITKERWAEMLELIKCSILSTTSNQHFDSYVLSESSLFVYPTKILLKTCGTTRTLLCLKKLLEFATDCQLEPEFVLFSRKNFLNPKQQHYPHTSFSAEVDFLNTFFVVGQGYTFGPQSSDHWNLYIADMTDNNRHKPLSCKMLEIMMTDLDRGIMEQFYKSLEAPTTAKDLTQSSGIGNIFPSAETDEFLFDPCGYSVNGLFNENFFTIHITPEPSCSFVSFETNAQMNSYHKLVDYIVTIFKPGSFQVSLFVDNECLEQRNLFALPGRDLSGYNMKTKAYWEYNHYQLEVAHFTRSN